MNISRTLGLPLMYSFTPSIIQYGWIVAYSSGHVPVEIHRNHTGYRFPSIYNSPAETPNQWQMKHLKPRGLVGILIQHCNLFLQLSHLRSDKSRLVGSKLNTPKLPRLKMRVDFYRFETDFGVPTGLSMAWLYNQLRSLLEFKARISSDRDYIWLKKTNAGHLQRCWVEPTYHLQRCPCDGTQGLAISATSFREQLL